MTSLGLITALVFPKARNRKLAPVFWAAELLLPPLPEQVFRAAEEKGAAARGRALCEARDRSCLSCSSAYIPEIYLIQP
ncbi:hypothetical protein NDU88_008107 [Pleurodeles waltl]|uniref:Uncharacterized protein n=1 Tax=Pleurodeles waltl TaxID=8319 RepID=A0AAV7N403_PLEWA|nr:hypothetical protein NDU88_008107 [Pleurodeles waltl]